MKKILLALIVVFSAIVVNAQECTWGVKGGVDVTSYKIGIEDLSLKINPGNKTGFYLGVVNNIKFSEQWGLQTELMYNYAGAKLSIGKDLVSYFLDDMVDMTDPDMEEGMKSLGLPSDLKVSYNTHTLRLPILAKFQPVGGLSILAGPYLAYRIGAKVKLNDNLEKVAKGAIDAMGAMGELTGISSTGDVTDQVGDLLSKNLKKFDIGATLGVEYAFTNGLFIDARYIISFLNKMKHDIDASSTEDNDGVVTNDGFKIKPKLRYSSVQIGVGFRF